MNKQTTEKIKNMLCEELDTLSKRELSSANLDLMHKLTDTIKNLDKITALESEGEYSEDGGWRAEGNYSRADEMMMHNRGSSYGGRRRDSMGRYSRDDGYSRETRNKMYSELQNMMDDEEMSGADRSAIRRTMDMLDRF